MLLSNSLFLDSEYKADCENKIKYLELIEGSVIDDSDIKKEENIEIVENTEIVEALEKKNNEGEIIDTTMVIFDSTPPTSDDESTIPNNYKYVDASGTLYPTKQISKNYNKIILDSGTN